MSDVDIAASENRNFSMKFDRRLKVIKVALVMLNEGSRCNVEYCSS
jgi:hypothetical protein